MISEEEFQYEKYTRFINDIYVRVLQEVVGTEIMGRKIDMNDPEEIAVAYWLLKNINLVEKK